ncbi:MAG: hypothetical protein ABSE64_04115 [Vulcanimicrobiaceae bacterium]
MTFSESIEPGLAVLVPCQRSISSIDDLKTEVSHLAAAEGLVGNGVWKDWGVVGLLLKNHDATKLAEEIRQHWPKYFRALSTEGIASRLRGPDTASILNEDGFFQFAWPDKSDTVGVDIILATANEPTVQDDRYATPTEIARSYVRTAGSTEYFIKNVCHGIRTNEDAAIWGSIDSEMNGLLKN